MTAECDALRGEIQRLRQELAGLDQRYMAASERQPINNSLTALRSKLENVKKVADTASSIAKLAKELADVAGGKAGRAASLAEAAFAAFQVILNEMRQYVLRARFDALENRLNAVERTFDIVLRANEAVNRRALEALRRLDLVELAIRVIDRTLEDFRRRITDLLGRVVDLEQWRRRVDALLENIDRQIVSLFIRINTVWDWVIELQAKVRALEVWRRIIQSQVIALEVLTAAAAAALAALSVIVYGLVKTVAVLVGQMAIVRAALITLTRTVASLVAQMAIVRSLLSQLLRKVIELTSRVLRLEAQINAIRALAQRALALAQRALSAAAAARALAQRALSAAAAARALAQQALSAAAAARALARQALGVANNALSRAIANTRRIAQLDFRVQILERFMEEIRQALADIRAKLFGAAAGSIDLTPCVPVEGQLAAAEFDGQGLEGVFSGIAAIAQAVETIHANTRCQTDDSNAALPMHFETRTGEIPQLVILWGPVDGGSNRWSMIVPHPKPLIRSNFRFAFPRYRKGNFQITYILKDNSKIIFNARSKTDGLALLSYLKSLVNPAFIDSLSEPRITEGAGQRRLQIVDVKATYVKHFLGHRNTAPNWTKRL
jgi:chromosome segregation ATPase